MGNYCWGRTDAEKVTLSREGQTIAAAATASGTLGKDKIEELWKAYVAADNSSGWQNLPPNNGGKAPLVGIGKQGRICLARDIRGAALNIRCRSLKQRAYMIALLPLQSPRRAKIAEEREAAVKLHEGASADLDNEEEINRMVTHMEWALKKIAVDNEDPRHLNQQLVGKKRFQKFVIKQISGLKEMTLAAEVLESDTRLLRSFTSIDADQNGRVTLVELNYSLAAEGGEQVTDEMWALICEFGDGCPNEGLTYEAFRDLHECGGPFSSS